jgi:hypothetical protein
MGSLDEALSAMLSNDHGQYSSLGVTKGSSFQWPFSRDEKWVLDAKNEAMEAPRVLASGHGTSGGLNPPPPGGLQRYHSAPSTFLECRADFNVDAFSQVSASPLEDQSLLNSFFVENLAPINERSSQQMDREKLDASSTLNDYEQFLATQHDFGRSASISPSTQPLSRQDHNPSGYSTPGN